jgi:NADPH2:quinone reductase
MSAQVVLNESLRTQVVEAPESPALTEGQVRLRVARAGVNFWEVMQRRGRVPIPAHRIPGSEGVGVVEEVGPGADALVAGQRVAWSRVPGSYSEVAVAPASAVVPVPDSVDDDSAAAVLFQGLTASYLCRDTWPLQGGDVAVVTAAAGGVGQLLTQLLVDAGARVIGVVSAQEKFEVTRAAGASDVLLYGDTLADEVRALAPDGVAAVYDAVGAGVAEPLLSTLRPRGAMVLYGSASGQDADISATNLGAGSYYLTRTAGRDYLGGDERIRARSAQLLDLVASGTLRPLIGGTYGLEDADRALDDLESRNTIGKLLIRPDIAK